tara:strand:- start:397 stop:576 length:180 start_codon:yes stop_codon:yes gene_type:complete
MIELQTGLEAVFGGCDECDGHNKVALRCPCHDSTKLFSTVLPGEDKKVLDQPVAPSDEI